jgi:class 3 adenylate cyclase
MSNTEYKHQKTELMERSNQRDETDRTQRAMLANLRHELLTPLNAIIGYSEMLLEDANVLGDKDTISDLGKIHLAGSQALELVNDAFDTAKFEVAPFDLALDVCGAKLRHELRTALNAVMGYSEMLLEDAENHRKEELITDLRKIHLAAERFLAIINDIVSVSKIEAGVMDVNLETVDTQSMIKDMAITMQLMRKDQITVAPEQGSLLVVDDNEINGDLLSRQLERHGHIVSVVTSGREALDVIKPQKFDLVLLDIMMPEINGYQVLQRLKRDENGRDIPVIMISALQEMESVARCIEIGAEDYLTKPFDPVLLKAKISACLERKRLRDQEVEYQMRLKELNRELEVRNRFIRATFGRYLSDDIANSILESPDGVALGGEKRKVVLLMSDLRGFTALTERLEPEQVVQTLNIYFEAMVDVVLKYNGTINEIIGDALLVIFGAPQQMPDRAKRAIACAVEMQNAMARVNEENRLQGLPEIEMGIGLNEDEVIVGNIGSSKRSKYGVVGSGVNMTSRIESYTVGGQILISDSVRKKAGDILRIDEQREVIPKGSEAPLKIYEVGGIGAPYNLALEEKNPALVALGRKVPLLYTALDGKDAGKDQLEGLVSRLSRQGAEIDLKEPLELLTNIKMNLGDVPEELASKDFYGKVIECVRKDAYRYIVRFTSVSPEVAAYFQALWQYGAKGMSTRNV